MYHLFAGEGYYPAGGVLDYRGVFYKPEEALALLQENFYVWDWAHLAILVEGKLKITHMYNQPGPYSKVTTARWSSPWDDVHQMDIGRKDWRDIVTPKEDSSDEP